MLSAICFNLDGLTFCHLVMGSYMYLTEHNLICIVRKCRSRSDCRTANVYSDLRSILSDISRDNPRKIKQLSTVHYTFPKQALVFTCLQYKSFENTVGKGEIDRNKQFLLFPQCFEFKIVVCKLFQFEESLKFVIWQRVIAHLLN